MKFIQEYQQHGRYIVSETYYEVYCEYSIWIRIHRIQECECRDMRFKLHLN